MMAAAALKLTAPDLIELNIADEIIPEPVGGAHTQPEEAAGLIKDCLLRHLLELKNMDARRFDEPPVRQVPRHGYFQGRPRSALDTAPRPVRCCIRFVNCRPF